MTRSDEITRILAAATKAAYDQGWADAVKAFEQAANAMPVLGDPEPQTDFHTYLAKTLPKRRGKPSKAADDVLMTIGAVPGNNGAFIAAQLPHIPERTVRTALRRLRLSGRIEQRQGGWFVKRVSEGT